MIPADSYEQSSLFLRGLFALWSEEMCFGFVRIIRGFKFDLNHSGSTVQEKGKEKKKLCNVFIAITIPRSK